MRRTVPVAVARHYLAYSGVRLTISLEPGEKKSSSGKTKQKYPKCRGKQRLGKTT
jgi:hypothetical protein